MRIFELYDPVRHKRFNKELLRIGYFELPKPNVETANQKHWRDYFKTGEVSGGAPEYIKKASWIIDYANLGKEEREVALALEKGQAIYEAEIVSSFLDGKDEGIIEGKAEGLAEGKAEGLIEGKAEGKAEGIIEGENGKAVEIAKSMLADGFKPDVVVKHTGLLLAQVNTLLI